MTRMTLNTNSLLSLVPPNKLINDAQNSALGIPIIQEPAPDRGSLTYGKVKSVGGAEDGGVLSNLISDKMVQEVINEMPIMRNIMQVCAKHKPFDGKRITVSQVLVPNTLPLIISLLQGGASLVVSHCFPSPFDESVHTLLINNGVTVELDYKKAASQAEYVLDCGGSLAGKHHAIGVVEVTRTGYHKYREAADRSVVINIDDARTKYIEDFFGTSVALMRAIDHYYGSAKGYLKDKTVAVIGFGKVGRGITSQLKDVAKNIIVFDTHPVALAVAEKLGCQTALVTGDLARNSDYLQPAQVVITCTGHSGVVTANFIKKELANKLLINMGAEDEYGRDYAESEVFHSKHTAINFNLTPPTENKYIDAILAAQIEGLNYLIKNSLKPGVHQLPRTTDTAIVEMFAGIHGISLHALNDYFGDMSEA